VRLSNLLMESNGSNVVEGAWLNERFLQEARRIPLSPGSAIIWNSKCIHQGWNKGPRLAMPGIHKS